MLYLLSVIWKENPTQEEFTKSQAEMIPLAREGRTQRKTGS